SSSSERLPPGQRRNHVGESPSAFLVVALTVRYRLDGGEPFPTSALSIVWRGSVHGRDRVSHFANPDHSAGRSRFQTGSCYRLRSKGEIFSRFLRDRHRPLVFQTVDWRLHLHRSCSHVAYSGSSHGESSRI